MPLIIVIEPHPLVRMGLLKLLSSFNPKPTLEGYSYDHLKNKNNNMRSCDLILLSIKPCEQSEEQILSINRKYIPKSILLLSEEMDVPSYLYGLLPSIVGVVYKNTTPEILSASTALALAGGTCFPNQKQSPIQVQPLIREYKSEKWPIEPEIKEAPFLDYDEANMLGLTPRQYEVLVLLSRGSSLKCIGKRLNISAATAKAHTETLYQRLDVHNRNAAVYAAVARGATLGWPNISTMPGSASDSDSKNY